MTAKSGKNSINSTIQDKEQAQRVAAELLLKMAENPGMTLKQATGISDAALEEIYCLAYNYYTQGKYAESITLFQFLAQTAPETKKYVLGLASSYHQAGNYEQAAVAFYVTLRLDPSDPLPAYYVTDCFLKQDLKEEAEEFAEIAILICEDKPEYAALKKRCELIIKTLKDKKIN